jgi:hypothetical protein
MDNVLEIGYKALSAAERVREHIISRLRADAMLIGDSNRIQRLLHRQTPDSPPDIVVWFIQDRLSKTYMSVSKSCFVALNHLTEDEKRMLPSKVSLIVFKNINFVDGVLRANARAILGSDWHG